MRISNLFFFALVFFCILTFPGNSFIPGRRLFAGEEESLHERGAGWRRSRDWRFGGSVSSDKDGENIGAAVEAAFSPESVSSAYLSTDLRQRIGYFRFAGRFRARD